MPTSFRRHTPRCGRIWFEYRKCSDGRPLTYASFLQGRFTMSDFRFFSTHRPWEDWFGMLLGVLIVVSPWFPFQPTHEVMDAERSIMILNTFVVGMLVFGLAQLEYVALQRWEEVAEIALGLWLIASPVHLRLFRRRHSAALACHARRDRGPARRASAMAGLAPERSGTRQPSAIAVCSGGQVRRLVTIGCACLLDAKARLDHDHTSATFRWRDRHGQ